jgi:Fe-S-cluster containining protein
MAAMPSDDQELFICQRCGQCCQGYGGTYLEADDIDAIAAFLGCSAAEFTERYCQTSCGRLLLAQREDGYCVFWRDLCTIHPVKPLMCRRWPYIPGVLRDVRNWRAMATACPGMRIDLPDEAILKRVAAELEAEADAK